MIYNQILSFKRQFDIIGNDLTDFTTFALFMRFSKKIFPWLRDNLEVYQIEVEDEKSGEKGIIGFGVLGEEIYREIPIHNGDELSWKNIYLKKFFESPGLIQHLTALKVYENV